MGQKKMSLTKEQIEEYKEKLYEEQEDICRVMHKPRMKNVLNSVIYKYSGKAHFLYEVIQNADDAEATEIHFELFDNRLIFRHNGKKRFTISDPSNEEEDQKNGVLGDINSILGVGFSTKADQKFDEINNPKIGKFGVGFKSVYQYTDTPIVYDSELRFKIVDFFLPIWQEDDFPGRKDNETVFVLPFNRSELSAKTAKLEILEKLQKLVMPVLFLHSIKRVSYKCGNINGCYSKDLLESTNLKDIIAQKIKIFNGGLSDYSLMWVFSRYDSEGRKYSIGYFVDENEKLVARPNYFTFCFFPTKVVSHLNFIIHAPFLLTDSREGIQCTSYNETMISLLALLSADALECFIDIGNKKNIRIIDDDIVKIIPIKRNDFDENDSDTISFLPFYSAIQQKMKKRLLPTNGGYVSTENACWAETKNLSDLISKVQLSKIFSYQQWNSVLRIYETIEPQKEWIFTSFGMRNSPELATYLKEIGVKALSIDELIPKLRANFIESQSVEWLCSLYGLIGSNAESIRRAKIYPIFLNENKNASAAFKDDIANLFLSTSNSLGYNVVLSEIEKNDDGITLLKKMGVSQPVLKDKIYQKLLNKKEFNEIDDFKDFLDYFIECENNGNNAEKINFVNTIKTKAFLAVVNVDGEDLGKSSPNSYVHLMNDELKIYYSVSKDIRFVDIDKYERVLSAQERNYLRSFLENLGISSFAINAYHEIDESEYRTAKGAPLPHSTRGRTCSKYYLIGAQEFLTEVTEKKNKEFSKILLHQMSRGFKNALSRWSKKDALFGYKCNYFYRSSWDEYIKDPDSDLFRQEKWLVDNSGNFVSPTETFLQRLSENYNISDPDIKNFLTDYLGIQREHAEYDDLNPDIRKKVELSDLLEKNGLKDISPEEIKLIKEMREKKTESGASSESVDGNGNGHSSSSNAKKISDDNSDSDENDYGDTPEKKITKEIAKLAENKKKGGSDQFEKDSEEDEADEDEYTKASIDYTKKIQKAKDKCAVEVYELKEYEAAQKLAIESKKYSYQWFSALLKLEILSSNESNSNSREVSITFSKIKKDLSSKKTLILEQPNKNIPSVIEELYGVNLNLRMKDGSEKSLPFEAASIRSYSLRVMLMHPEQLVDLDLGQVTSASIIAKSPVFLLQELQKQFDALSFAPDYNMKASLCKNIRFVFGPPGTGKTTFLAKNVLKKLVDENENIKVLVLAPTNKAADVIVSRTIDIMSSDDGYKNWLARFGVTNDETIEENGIFCSKNYDIEKHNQNVVVTTIARYPYDGMKSEDKEDRLLRDVEWDYVVIDEASMIPLVQLIYVLYSQKPKQFIIAGDPFQIEPTTAVDMWKDENIYKMVKLDSFTNIRTEPHKFEVELLKTQYRSVPSVGEIFSALTYESSLTHYRKEESLRTLNIEEYLSYSSLNLVKFPVHKYESIYRSKKLNKSNYQIYSALFAYEFTFYLAKKIAEKNPSEHFKIGVISPYAAQAKLINNLLIAEKIPDSVSVLCGTIHGFQGDECDVLVTVFNAPESMSSNDNMFLNRKNIVNVAISRAKDYLFVLMPDDKTEKVENLKLVKKVEELMKNNSLCTEIGSHELEKKIFGNETYLEENTFSTGHQSVNVYGTPEKKYEVRSEENAIDIQVHKEIV
jgi:hypothetical protein